MDRKGYWHNYKTGQYEYRYAPDTDEDALALLPQYPAAQGMFEVYREMGKSILDAMDYTLSACVGEPIREEVAA